MSASAIKTIDAIFSVSKRAKLKDNDEGYRVFRYKGLDVWCAPKKGDTVATIHVFEGNRIVLEAYKTDFPENRKNRGFEFDKYHSGKWEDKIAKLSEIGNSLRLQPHSRDLQTARVRAGYKPILYS